MTPALCNLVGPFADAELQPREARVFREHLVACEACQRRLLETLQLDVMVCAYFGDDTVQVPSPEARGGWYFGTVLALGALLYLLLQLLGR